MSKEQYVCTLSCPNRPGIVAAITGRLAAEGGNILEAHQFDDVETRRFFMRMVFDFPGPDAIDALREAMAPIGEAFAMAWSIRPRSRRTKVLLLASKFDHCLADMLYRWRIGELAMDVVGVAS